MTMSSTVTGSSFGHDGVVSMLIVGQEHSPRTRHNNDGSINETRFVPGGEYAIYGRVRGGVRVWQQ